MATIKCGNNYGMIFKEEKSVEVLKLLTLIVNVEECQEKNI